MLNDESSADQDSITVQSPGTSFWTAMLFEGRPDPERVLSTAQSAFEEEYEELDVYESTVTVMGIPAFAREVEFVCLDLITTAFLVSFQTLDRTVLLMFQGEDRELKSTRPILEAMTRSFSCDLQRIPDGPTVDT